jgi:hypothetical protein
MAASKKQVKLAKEMAAAGKSAAQIAQKTGVSGNKAGSLAYKASAPAQSPYTDGVTYQLNDQGTAPVRSQYVDGVTYKLNDQGTAPVQAWSPDGSSYSLNNQASSGSSNKGSGVGESLRIAGANGNLSKNELLSISKQTGKGVDRIIQRLDEVNAKEAGKNKAPIGLGHGAYNHLLKMPTSRTIYGQTMSQLGFKDKYNNFGTGAIGRAITQGKGTSDYYGNSVAGTGKIPKGQQVFGSYNNAPQVQVKPQNNVNSGYYGPGSGNGVINTNPITTNNVPVSTNTTQPQETLTLPDTTPTPTTDETKSDVGGFSGGYGSGVDGGATSFRRKKSSARTSGLTTRGTGQFRNSLKVGAASGINTGM